MQIDENNNNALNGLYHRWAGRQLSAGLSTFIMTIATQYFEEAETVKSLDTVNKENVIYTSISII